MPTAYQTVVLLIEVIEIVCEVAHGNKSFTLVVVDLYIEAPFGDAGNNSGIDFAEMVVHIFHLLEFNRCAFGVGGKLFHLRRVFALLFELLDVDRTPAGHIAFKQAVHHHVGIAADGRGEVGVVVEAEAVVADVLGGVDSLGHRTDGERRQEVLLAFALDVDEHLVY